MNKFHISSERSYNIPKKVRIVGQWKWNIKENSMDLSNEVFQIFEIYKEKNMDNFQFFMNLIHSKFPEIFQKDISKITNIKAPFVQNHYLKDKNGNYRFINIVGIPKFNSSEDIIELYGFVLDMTDLYQSEAKYGNFWEESLDAFVIYDSNFRFVDANKVLMNDFFPEFAKEDLIGKHISEIVPGIEQTERFKLYKRVLDTGKPLTIEEINPNEKFGPRSLYVKAFKYDENLGIIFSDIAELKKKEFELEKYQQHLEDLLEIRNNEISNLAKFPSQNPAPVLRVSKKEILYANESAKKIFLLDEKKEIPIIIQQNIAEVLLNEKPKTIEWGIETNTYLLSFIPFKNLEYVNVYGTDITKLKNTEKMFEKFVSNVVHELRTPISVLQMSLKYFQKKKGEMNLDLENQILNSVFRNTTLINELIEGLISSTKSETSKLELQIEEFSINELILELIEDITPLVLEKNIQILCNINKNIKVSADKSRIRQVFQILIDNALKYSHKDSEVIINASINPSKNGRKHELLIEFIDEGIGITQEDLLHLFERFYRSKKVVHIEGTGLGLSIAKKIIKSHGGKIYASQNLDKGATFSIVLPNYRII